jgi:hypothetical protein
VTFSSACLLLLGVPLLQASENSGIRMTIQYSGAGISNQQTIYLQEDRKRMEFQNSEGRKNADGSVRPIYGPRLVAITRCDLGQTFELNLDTREYTSAPYPPKPFTQEELKARGLDAPVAYVSDKPTLRIEVTTTDTGERKEIFGHTARHVITARKQIPLEGSASMPQESVTDGWYIDSSSGSIDLRQRLPCDRKWPEGKQGHANAYLQAFSGRRPPMDKPEFVTNGEPETGFVLQSTMTSKNTYTLPDGTKKQSNSKFEVDVTQIEEAPLDPALFEIPPGFKRVDHIERNPAVASPSQISYLWQRFKASVASLFNR